MRVPNEIGAEAAAQLTCSSVAGREDLIGREVDMNHDAGAALAARFDGGDACDRTRGAPAAGGARKPSGARCAQTVAWYSRTHSDEIHYTIHRELS